MCHGRALLALVLISSGIAGACGTEPPVPASPTWVDDVQPILRGNCLNCHGVSARFTELRTKRWDVCELNAFAAVGPFADTSTGEFVGAKLHIPAVFAVYIQPHGASRPLMPPQPDPVLSDRQTQVLAAWDKNPVCGQRSANHKPTAAWLVKPTTIVVEDGDDDQVLGTIQCGAVQDQILHTGAQGLPAGAAPPCTLMLSDGQDQVMVSLSP